MLIGYLWAAVYKLSRNMIHSSEDQTDARTGRMPYENESTRSSFYFFNQ